MSTNIVLGTEFKQQLVTGDKSIVDVNGVSFQGPESGGAISIVQFGLKADGGVLFGHGEGTTPIGVGIKVKASTITSESSITVTDPNSLLSSSGFSTDGDGYRQLDVVLNDQDDNATLEWTWNDINFRVFIDGVPTGG
jgi:hypothetical protein